MVSYFFFFSCHRCLVFLVSSVRVNGWMRSTSCTSTPTPLFVLLNKPRLALGFPRRFFFLRARLSVCWDERSWTHEWLTGKGEMPKEELWNRDSPVWSRFYSSPGGIELGAEAEADLQQVWVMEGRRG